jgi:hypothetical protein
MSSTPLVPDADEIAALAEEYLDAPDLPTDFDLQHRVAQLWLDAAAWFLDRANRLRRRCDVRTESHEYPSCDELFADIDSGRLVVHPGETFPPHPLWGARVNEAARIVHDIDGHHAAQQGFAWEPEVHATWLQMRMTPVRFRPVVFAQQLHQLAVTTHTGQFPERQKVLLTRHHFIREGVTPR